MNKETFISTGRCSSVGEILKKELKSLGITQKEFAEVVGMSASHLSEIIKGRRPITVKQAEKIQSVLGIPAVYWIEMQANQAVADKNETKLNEEEREAGTLLAQYDEIVSVKDLVRRQGIKATTNIEKVEMLQKVYMLPEPQILSQKTNNIGGFFRKSSKQGLDSRMIATWIVLAEHDARNREVDGVFNRNELLRVASELRKVFHENMNTIAKVTAVLSAYGIKFCVVEKLEHASIDGFSFIENGQPAIVVTTRHKRIDNLAFAVLHEVYHTYRHLGGNKQSMVSIEDYDNDCREEREANDFAGNTLIPLSLWENAPSVPMNPFIIQREYTKWAQRYGLNKWIVLGRVSHETGMYKFKADESRQIH
jgi:HTH-type transcriptional regulator/antitoxin HigA